MSEKEIEEVRVALRLLHTVYSNGWVKTQLRKREERTLQAIRARAIFEQMVTALKASGEKRSNSE